MKYGFGNILSQPLSKLFEVDMKPTMLFLVRMNFKDLSLIIHQINYRMVTNACRIVC